jgi:hypothetical protein
MDLATRIQRLEDIAAIERLKYRYWRCLDLKLWIELTSATSARGTWALYNYLFNAAQKRSVRIGAYYHDEYVKVAGVWKIAHTGYTYVFREEWSREDTPSLRVLAP